MKRTFIFTVAAALMGMLAYSGVGFAAPGGDPGPPDDGGGAAPDFGDLIILLRDEYGVPIPSDATLVEDPETGELVDGGLCWQPIAFNVDDDVLCPTDCQVTTTTPTTVDVDQYNCAVATGCSGCTQEVDFGRINEARSPEEVFASQLEDVVVTLATADCRTLDPAGRIVASNVDDTTLDNLAKTVDSPLQSLAIYRELILTGSIGAPLPEGAGILDTAARGLGAASDKSGGVNVDLVAYLNQIMGLSDPLTTTILDPKLCETYREEVQGVIQLVEKCFLNYGAYDYNRDTNFGALPAPPYIPADEPAAGTFEYLSLVDETDPPLFEIRYDLITTAVFEEAAFEDVNIRGFAQASDDARAVIAFMHENQVPVDFETPVPCTASGDIFYDLSISEQSGLQVPKNYVSGGEREFFVNVTNLGPDEASGTVTVEASYGGEPDTWVLSFEDLPEGQTASFTVFFTITTTSDTINWSAAVVADPPGTDPNLLNNSVSAVSSVRAAGGSGGGGQGGNPN